MANTQTTFNLMKFIGNTVYAYGPIKRHPRPANYAEIGSNPIIQESSNYLEYQLYDNGEYDAPYTDVYVSNTTSAINSGGEFFTKHDSDFYYENDLYKIFIVKIRVS